MSYLTALSEKIGIALLCIFYALMQPKRLQVGNFYFSIATGSLIEKLRVHFSQFVEIRKRLPCIDEQRKIADFITTYDKKIEAIQKEADALETIKKGLMQRLFAR